MTKLMAPILAFTCDEIWQAMPHRPRDGRAANVVFNEMNQPFTAYALDEAAMAAVGRPSSQVRDVVNGALETARAEKKIGKSLEANIALTVPAEDAFLAAMDAGALADLLIVSQVTVSRGRGHPGRCDQRRRGQVPALLEGAAHGECRRPVPPVRPGAPVPGVNTPSKGPPVPSGPLLWPGCPEKGAFFSPGRQTARKGPPAPVSR